MAAFLNPVPGFQDLARVFETGAAKKGGIKIDPQLCQHIAAALSEGAEHVAVLVDFAREHGLVHTVEAERDRTPVERQRLARLAVPLDPERRVLAFPQAPARVTAKARHDASVAALETDHAKAKKTAEEQQAAIIEGLAIWASANRDRLTNGGKTKTVQLPTGSILWREGRHSVKQPKKNDDLVAAIRLHCNAVLGWIAEAKADRKKVEAEAHEATLATLKSFLRIKAEPNKEAMLAAREVAETGHSIRMRPCARAAS